jgi:hypothetical protein
MLRNFAQVFKIFFTIIDQESSKQTWHEDLKRHDKDKQKAWIEIQLTIENKKK